MGSKIKVGDYIIVQRQNYTKLHKYGKTESTVVLAKDTIELNNIAEAEHDTVFRMISKEAGNRGRKRVFFLEPATDVVSLKEVLDIKECGTDNRDIVDDGCSQALSNEEILSMKDNFTSTSDIVGQLISNSKTFTTKTEYSQEKYIKKKEKKYFEFIQIRKPTIRLLTEMFYRQEPDKIQGIRVDTLSQIVSYTGVSSDGNYLLYESGSNGLLPATFLNSMGNSGNAKLVHVHPGNFPQKQAVLALNLEDSHMKKCISVNLYSVLRQFYQKPDETVSGKRKIEDNGEDSENLPKKHIGDDNKITEKSNENEEKPSEIPAAKPVTPKPPKWIEENAEALKIMENKVDCLLVAAREHPLNIVKELMQFVAPSRPIIIFNLSKEILMECYMHLKNCGATNNLRLTSNWMRTYQILPERTHPTISMQGNSGYLLVGYKVKND